MPTTIDTDSALFERLRPRLTAISCRIVGSVAEAEDIVQDCFFKWRGAEQAALATPAAWLTTVVQHQSIDRLRRRARDTAAARTAMELAPAIPPAPPEEGLLRRAALGEALSVMLARLSPSERLTLVLHEVFECDHADVAAALGTTAVNARQYLARARRRLRAHEARVDTSGHTPASEKLCRELLLRFQAAINGRDVPAMVSLLGAAQPVSVYDATTVHDDASPCKAMPLDAAPPLRLRASACANDACYHLALAA